MTRDEAREVLKLCVQPMNWYSVKRMAEAVGALGDEAAAEFQKLGEWKHQRAVDRGDAYSPSGMNFTKPSKPEEAK